MKQKIIFIITIIISITGCTTKEYNSINNIYTDDKIINNYNISSSYDLSKAESDGFVIYDLDKVINEEKIEDFYNDTQANKESILNIIKYTIEGDPIIIEYVYKEGKFIVYEDYTRDEYSNEDIIVKEIKEIELSYDNDGHRMIVEKY